MRKLVSLLLAGLILLFPLYGTIAFAEEDGESSSQVEPFDYEKEIDNYLENGAVGELTDNIPNQAQEFLSNGGGMSELVKSFTPKEFFPKVLMTIRRTLAAPLRLLVSLVGVIILCAVLGSFNTSLGQSSLVPIFNVIICVFVSSIIIDPVVLCITEASNTIREFSIFILSFIPVFAGVVTASGQPMTGAAYNLFVFWMCQITSQLITNTFVPLLCAYLALSIISVVCPEMHLADAVSGIKTFVTWSLTLILTVFVGLLTIQSVVASGGDSIAVKTTKFFIGSLIPVVGGALSDLFMAAQGCIKLVKGTVGAFGIIITALTFLPVLLQTVVWYITVNIGGLIGNLFGVGQITKLLKAISSTLGILIAVLLYYSLLIIISTTIIIVAFQGG
ncbi:MAG: hypothetical protein VB100_08180 [Angelakisella sp.]|nr:hypothetical protein [Angelakisella sp.]